LAWLAHEFRGGDDSGAAIPLLLGSTERMFGEVDCTVVEFAVRSNERQPQHRFDDLCRGRWNRLIDITADSERHVIRIRRREEIAETVFIDIPAIKRRQKR